MSLKDPGARPGQGGYPARQSGTEGTITAERDPWPEESWPEAEAEAEAEVEAGLAWPEADAEAEVEAAVWPAEAEMEDGGIVYEDVAEGDEA